jgi:hypothetical protein
MATNFVMRQVLKKIRFDAPTVDTSQKVAGGMDKYRHQNIILDLLRMQVEAAH